MNQKRRKDLFIGNREILKTIDNFFYDKLYTDIKSNFSDIKYGEKWKLGHYNHEDNGFYNLHTDTAGYTKYRKTSCVTMLSNSSDYDVGELYFPALDEKIKLDKGDVIVFNSSLLHGVYPVTEGERNVLISFFFDDDGMKIKESFTKNINYNNYRPYLSNLKLEYSDNSNYKSGREKSSYNKGDIDYSDLHHKDKWNDNDDYYFENNNSDILIVTLIENEANGNYVSKSDETALTKACEKNNHDIVKLLLHYGVLRPPKPWTGLDTIVKFVAFVVGKIQAFRMGMDRHPHHLNQALQHVMVYWFAS